MKMKENKKILDLLKKLDGMYEKEERLKKEMITLQVEYKQLQEDKDLLQSIIMHQSNKSARMEEWLKKR